MNLFEKIAKEKNNKNNFNVGLGSLTLLGGLGSTAYNEAHRHNLLNEHIGDIKKEVGSDLWMLDLNKERTNDAQQELNKYKKQYDHILKTEGNSEQLNAISKKIKKSKEEIDRFNQINVNHKNKIKINKHEMSETVKDIRKLRKNSKIGLGVAGLGAAMSLYNKLKGNKDDVAKNNIGLGAATLGGLGAGLYYKHKSNQPVKLNNILERTRKNRNFAKNSRIGLSVAGLGALGLGYNALKNN